MASVADAFGDDLEQIRQVRRQSEVPPAPCPHFLKPSCAHARVKEPDMTKSRLALLIDSLASGGEVFSSHTGENGKLNEMDVVLNSNSDI
jgi:ribosome assembly protein 3